MEPLTAEQRAPALPAWLTAGRLLRGGGALVLVVLLIGTKWYGVDTHVDGALGQGEAGALSGWRLLSVVRWLVLLSAALSLLSAAVPTAGSEPLVVLAGALAVGLTAVLFVRVLIWVPDARAVVDIKPGAYLALVAVAATALGSRRSS